MADPLTEVTDQFAPAPLNFFDAGRAQSISARYGAARRGAAVTDELAKSRARAQNMEIDRERQERSRILADREDLEHADKLTNREERAGFLEDLDGFDVSDPEANTKLTGVLKGIAERTPALLEDPVTKEFMALKFRQIDKADAERQRIADQQRRQDFTIEAIRERQKGNKTLANLTDEDLKNAPRDADGNIDMLALGIIAARRERANEMDEFKEKEAVRQENRKELLDINKMDDTQKAIHTETKNILINDTKAFPTQLSSVQAKARGAKVPEAIINDPAKLAKYPGFEKETAEAVAWDKNKFENEVLTAQKAKSKEEYVNLVSGLTPFERTARERVYDYARQNDDEESATPAPAPAAPASAAPASESPQIKVLDGVTYMKKPEGGWVAVKGE